MASVKTSIALPEEEKAIIEKWAKKHDLSMSQVVRRAIKMYIREEIMKEKKKLLEEEKKKEEQDR